jgi:hypothetical protein
MKACDRFAGRISEKTGRGFVLTSGNLVFSGPVLGDVLDEVRPDSSLFAGYPLTEPELILARLHGVSRVRVKRFRTVPLGSVYTYLEAAKTARLLGMEYEYV